MLGPLSVVCLGAVAMYVFFAALGGINPSEVLWPTIVVGVLAMLFLVRSIVVRHELAAGGGHTTARAVNSLRERRGF
jgi:tetrahydromethanopterin S-methyltransferase subunit C